MNNTNIKKQYQQTSGLIQRLNNNIELLSVGVIVSEKFCFSKFVVCCLQVCLAWKTISCQTDMGNRLKHVQFSQGVPVWRLVNELTFCYAKAECKWLRCRSAERKISVRGLNHVMEWSRRSSVNHCFTPRKCMGTWH